MILEILGHAEGLLDLLGSEHGSHGLIGGVVLLGLGILEVLLLQVSPEPLATLKERERVVVCERNDWKIPTYLRPGDLLSRLGADDLGQLRGHVELHLDNYQQL